MSLDEPENAPLDHPTLPLGWKTVVDLDGITWGDLRRLVALATWKEDGDQVELDCNYDDIPAVPIGIVLRGEG